VKFSVAEVAVIELAPVWEIKGAVTSAIVTEIEAVPEVRVA
jgi:hypothetical protein